ATTPAQMPELATGRSGSRSGFQPFQSPMTETPVAFGAHTAKWAPPSTRCAPSFSHRRRCVPSLKRYASCAVRRLVSGWTRAFYRTRRHVATPDLQGRACASGGLRRRLPSPARPSRSATRMRNIVDLVELADVVDILLVAALVYTAVVWVRRTQAGFVAIG